MPSAPIWGLGDSTVALGSSHFSVTPFLLYLPSGVVRCIGSPFVLLCSAGLLCGFIWLCPFFHGLRFVHGGSASQPGPSSVFPPLSGASATPSVLLSQCLVMVLLSLCSWLLVQSLPVLWLLFLRLLFLTFDCLRSHWCLASIDQCLVALIPLAAGFSQAPLPPCCLYVEFLLLLLLLVIMSFCLGLSVYAPHSVAPARSVSLLASGLPGSSLCILGCFRVLLGRFFLVSTAPVATSWLASFGVRFPGLSVSVGGLVDLVPVARVPCRLFVVFCLVECSLFACFCLALQVPVLFILLGPDLSLSRLFLLQPSRPWGCSLLAPVSVFAAIVARVVPRHLSCGIPVGIPQFL